MSRRSVHLTTFFYWACSTKQLTSTLYGATIKLTTPGSAVGLDTNYTTGPGIQTVCKNCLQKLSADFVTASKERVNMVGNLKIPF